MIFNRPLLLVRFKKRIAHFTIAIISAVLLFFIVSERWIGKNHENWRLIVDSDGRGYYAYLPAIFIYHDLYFDFVYRQEAKIYNNGSKEYLYLYSGERGNKYFIGEALLISPFFLVAWFFSWLAGMSLTGYNVLFFCSVSIAALSYLVIALIFIRKFLKLYGINEIVLLASLMLLVFGTNIFHYVVFEPSMSHIYSFAAVSSFLFFIKKYQLQNRTNNLLLSAASLGIIFLIRPVNILIVLAIPFLAGSFSNLKIIFIYFLKNK